MRSWILTPALVSYQHQLQMRLLQPLMPDRTSRTYLTAAQPGQSQQPPRCAAIEQQCRTFAAAASAVEAALEQVVASGRSVAVSQRGKVLDPAEVLRLLRLPAVGHAALPHAEVPARLMFAAAAQACRDGSALTRADEHSTFVVYFLRQQPKDCRRTDLSACLSWLSGGRVEGRQGRRGVRRADVRERHHARGQEALAFRQASHPALSRQWWRCRLTVMSGQYRFLLSSKTCGA